jgi:hypothetical protein
MKRLGSMLAVLLLGLLPGLASAGAIFNLPDELRVLERGESLPLHISGAKYRVAAFTYEDPDGTQLGDALAAIVGREVLVRANVSSIGVLTYEGGLAPTGDDGLSYFDKVEKVADAQQVTLSMWGMVRRSGSTLRVDTYVQIPPRLIEKTFVWRVKLPRSMGGGELIAHLRPERILAQSLELPAGAADGLIAAAQKQNELRAEPDDSSAVVATLPKGSVYWIEKAQGNWILMNAGANRKGWVRRIGICAGPCAPLLDAARFGAEMLQYAQKDELVSEERRHMGASRLWKFSGKPSPDAQAIQDQLAAYDVIDGGRLSDLQAISQQIEERLRTAARSGVVPPGGAGLANALAVDRIVQLLWQEASERARQAGKHDVMALYDDVAPERARVGDIAFDLADASLSDPDNADVLHNLSVLFQYVGDEKRANLARTLAAQKAQP